MDETRMYLDLSSTLVLYSNGEDDPRLYLGWSRRV